VFISRPNRFIANVEIDGKIKVCHVKNTGRCRELLTDRARVIVQEFDTPTRKTKFDLINVYKGDRLINMDSQSPNKIFAEWAPNSGVFGNITLLRPETKFGNSRFDFYMEAVGRKAFVEIKGVTLEDNGVVRFPDAPTERGVKHVRELMECINEGYDAYIVFIVQMKDVLYLEPNWDTHREFGEALREASEHGVKVLAVDCEVTEDTVVARDMVEVRL
jgi:sugar fermentation stimulation protein A